MNRDEAHKLVDQIFDGLGHAPGGVSTTSFDIKPELVAEEPARVLPEGKRAVRTKTSGDRVYLLDDSNKTRAWVTNEEILNKLGFTQADVIEVDDNEMMKYTMGPAIYKVD